MAYSYELLLKGDESFYNCIALKLPGHKTGVYGNITYVH